MGLAERFKEELKTKNIFEKSNIEKNLEEQHIQFISKPANDVIIEQTSQPKIEKPKFENLETEIISKIRKTPYWEEFSVDRQKNMIEKYFESKTKNKEYTQNEKTEFIKNILILSNNK